jgi:hypothetical protein
MEKEIIVDGKTVKVNVLHRASGLVSAGSKEHGAIFVCRDTEEEALMALKDEMERQYGQGRIEL